MFEARSGTKSLALCLLVWDCHGVQVNQVIHNNICSTPRPEISGTNPEKESAVIDSAKQNS